MRNYTEFEKGGMVTLRVENEKVEFQFLPTVNDDQWDICPQQSPCKVYIIMHFL